MAEGWTGMRRSARDILYIVFRHKWKILGLWLAISAGTVYFTLSAPDIFRSEAQLLIRLGRESISLDPSVSGPVVGVSQNRDNEVKSEVAILTSAYVADQVVARLGEERFLDTSTLAALSEVDAHYRAVQRVMDGLVVSVAKNTSVIGATFEAPDPQVAQSTLDTIIQFYLERHIELHRNQASPEFFLTQTEQLRSNLEASDGRLNQFRQAHSISSLETQITLRLQEINALYLERYVGGLDDSPASLSGADARAKLLEEALQQRPERIEISRMTGINNDASDLMKVKLIELQIQEKEFSSRYEDNYRPLVELREQIDEVKAALAKEEDTHTAITTGLDNGYLDLKVSLEKERANSAAYQARQAELTDQIARKEEEVAELTRLQLEHDSLVRDAEAAELEYMQYRENLHRAQISAALDLDKVSNVGVVQPATFPQKPVRPNRPLNVVLGTLLGLGVAMGFAFFLDYSDESLRTDADVIRRLQLPVFASISERDFKKCI